MSVEAKLEGIEAKLEEMRKLIEGLEGRLKPEPTVLSLVDAAKRLGVSLSTMKRMVLTKEIRTATVGKREMIPLSELTRVSTPDPEREKVETKQRAAAWVEIPRRRNKR